MKSRPLKSPWGLHKVRITLQTERLDRFLRHCNGFRSPMSMRFFDMKLARFHQNWSSK